LCGIDLQHTDTATSSLVMSINITRDARQEQTTLKCHESNGTVLVNKLVQVHLHTKCHMPKFPTIEHSSILHKKLACVLPKSVRFDLSGVFFSYSIIVCYVFVKFYCTRTCIRYIWCRKHVRVSRILMLTLLH